MLAKIPDVMTGKYICYIASIGACLPTTVNVLTLNIRCFVRNYAKRSLTVSAFHVEGLLQNDKKMYQYIITEPHKVTLNYSISWLTHLSYFV